MKLKLLVFFLLQSSCSLFAAQDSPPNILLILADDLGYSRLLRF